MQCLPRAQRTLEMYAAAKALPVDFLSSLGLATTVNPHAPRRMALAIPYRNADGHLHRKRIRAGLARSKGGQDRRMLWDQQPEGHGTILYGLDRLPARGTVILRKERVTHIRFGYMALARSAFLVQPTSSQSAMTVTSKTVRWSSSWKVTQAA